MQPASTIAATPTCAVTGSRKGDEVAIGASVRHFLARRDTFEPFVRAGIAVGIVRFGNDDVTGLAIPIQAGGGVRASVAPSVSVTAQGELDLGLGAFGHTLGLEPQFSVAVTAGVEFKL